MVYIHQSQLGNYGSKLNPVRKFGEDVCELFFKANGEEMKKVSLDLFADNVAVEINVFRSFVKALVVCDVFGRFVVTI